MASPDLTLELIPSYMTYIIKDCLEHFDAELSVSQMKKAVKLLKYPETGTEKSRKNSGKLIKLISENLDSRLDSVDATCFILERLNRKDDIHEDWFDEKSQH